MERFSLAPARRTLDLMTTPIYWGKCRCHIWPLVAGYPVRACGECGQYPRPVSGRAERI